AGNANAGDGQAVALTPHTRYFWFFGRSHVEMGVKALDGRAVDERDWGYPGGPTHVNVVMTGTHTLTGATRTYVNPAPTAFQPIQDSGAFAGCTTGDRPPHAAFTAACVGRTCTVSTQASDDGGITGYGWDWGDGSAVLHVATSADQTHTY